MRIGTPSLELALVVANVTVACCVGVVYLTRGAVISDATALDVTSARPAGPPALIVVAADRPTDLAVAQAAAAVLGGAALALPAGGLSAGTAAELGRSRHGRVIVLGGPAVVSEASATALAEHTSGEVVRLHGGDRHQTAAKVATSLFPAPVAQVRIMSGDDPDVAGPASDRSVGDAPLLLVAGHRIPPAAAEALRLLRPRGIVVSGSASDVSDAVVQELRAYTAGQVVREPASTPTASG